MTVETVCTTCPNSCTITVEVENGQPVGCRGNLCPKGESFAFDEVRAPKRVLTTTVLLRTGEGWTLLPVRTARPIPRELQQEAAALLRTCRVQAPVRMGDILVEDLLGTGIPVIASKTVSEPRSGPRTEHKR